MLKIANSKKFITFFFILLTLSRCGNDHLQLPDVRPSEEYIVANEIKAIGFGEVYEKVIQPRCVLCHNGSSAMAELDMQTAEVAYNSLVGVVSSELPNILRVEAGDPNPASSYLVAKIIEEPEFRRLSRMPLTGAPLSENDIQLIIEWIEGGAQR